MSQGLLALLGTAMLLTFVACCMASGLLQIRAWMRHTRPDVPVSPRALLHPEAYFDEIGLWQIHLSKRLLTLGGISYVGFALMSLFGRTVG